MRFRRDPRRTLTTLLAAALAALALGLAAPGTAAASPAVSTYGTTVHGDAADVYHPAGASGPLPVALMLQGAKVDRSFYAGYARAVAAQGFVVVVPNHYRLLIVEWERYVAQRQVPDTVEWMAAENGNASSALRGKIDTDTLVLLGHSFGGAAGLAVAEDRCRFPFCTTLGFDLPREVKAASFFGTNNAVLGTFANIYNDVPVQLVQGAADGMAAPADAEATYARLKRGPKQIVRVAGVNHYGITDVQNPAGAEADTGAQTVTQTESIATTARWAGAFLRARLGDAAAAAYVWSTGDAADPAVTVTGQRER